MAANYCIKQVIINIVSPYPVPKLFKKLRVIYNNGKSSEIKSTWKFKSQIQEIQTTL